MGISRYKICPVCGKRNPTTVLECMNCDTDLTNEQILDDEHKVSNTTSHFSSNHSSETENHPKYVLICPECKHRNAANATECERCHRNLEDVDPEEYSSNCSLDVTFENYTTHRITPYRISSEEVLTIGVEAFLSEEMSGCDYVSRKHCEIKFTNGELFIKDISGRDFEGNGTYINGRRLIRHKPERLVSGSIIGLGDPSPNERLAAFFKVSFDNI